MKKLFNVTFLFLCLSFFCAANIRAASDNKEKVLYSVDFSKIPSSIDVKEWLEKEGFDIKKDPSELSIYYDKDSLVFDTKGKIFSYMLKSSLNVTNAKKIKITWGVNEFPQDASYEKGVRNEALMIYVYYGKKFMDSGSIFVPNSPYFLGLYLSKNDPMGKYYTGRHYKEGGRFVCIGNPSLNETVISESDLQENFKKAFGENKTVPPISGIGLEVETTNTGNAKAFIKKIEILG